MAYVNKTAYRQAARAASVDPVFDLIAQELAGRVRAEALRHKKSGRLASSVLVRRGRIDRVVEITDPEAWHIEFGHASAGKHGSPGRWVKGLHILSSQAKAMGGS